MLVRWTAALAISVFTVGCFFFVGVGTPTIYDLLRRYFRPEPIWALMAVLVGIVTWLFIS